MTTDPNDHRPPHAPDVGFVSRGSVFALCSCGALQIVDPAHSRHARPWLRKLGWSRPPTNLADPDDGWLCPTCTTPHDARPPANRITVTPETLRRAEALGFEPGTGDVLLWALRAAEGWREERQRSASLAATADRYLGDRNAACDAREAAVAERDAMAVKLGVAWADLQVMRAVDAEHLRRAVRAEAERDAARRDLARIVQLCGWDTDGNDPESPSGAAHLYADAVQAVRELVEERAEDSREIVLLHRLCSEAADMLNKPTSTGGDAIDAMADQLRAAAGHDTDTDTDTAHYRSTT